MNFTLGGQGISNDTDQTATAPTWQPVRSCSGNTDAVMNLTLGTVVGPTSVTGNDLGGTETHFTTFTSGTQGYVGFSVELASSTIAYGWALVTLQDDNTPGVIHSWAYDNAGAPLAVGVLEPSHGLLVALGACRTYPLRQESF
ncbi:MAG: hypothetical protein ACI8XO_000755 [Verrucomicrobiales bacterium]|jgi:hypothetical protein